jgi:hypothetical protein
VTLVSRDSLPSIAACARAIHATLFVAEQMSCGTSFRAFGAMYSSWTKYPPRTTRKASMCLVVQVPFATSLLQPFWFVVFRNREASASAEAFSPWLAGAAFCHAFVGQ